MLMQERESPYIREYPALLIRKRGDMFHSRKKCGVRTSIVSIAAFSKSRKIKV
jgi:hypothetical protein